MARRALFLLTALLFCACLIGDRAMAQGKPELLVYLEIGVAARAFQKQLQAAMPSLNVSVTSKYREFEHALREGPDAVLAPQPVLKRSGLREARLSYRQDRVPRRRRPIPRAPNRPPPKSQSQLLKICQFRVIGLSLPI